VRGYPSYVKKIIFPLDILPLVPLGARWCTPPSIS
jgi:lipopolysaccharide transport system permease protein